MTVHHHLQLCTGGAPPTRTTSAGETHALVEATINGQALVRHISIAYTLRSPRGGGLEAYAFSALNLPSPTDTHEPDTRESTAPLLPAMGWPMPPQPRAEMACAPHRGDGLQPVAEMACSPSPCRLHAILYTEMLFPEIALPTPCARRCIHCVP